MNIDHVAEEDIKQRFEMSPQKTALRILLVYLFLVILSVAGNILFLHNSGSALSSATVFVSSIATSSLTHGVLASITMPSIANILFALLILQATGLLFNATLFWQCRQIFGDASDRQPGFRDAFITTFWITLICQSLLIVFFLYSIPVSEVPEGRKIWAVIAMSAGSFHLAGIPFYHSFFSSTFLGQNFIVQLGITGGATLGSLGIFVIHELFSVHRLRQRLADTSIDWSFITKVSVFIGGVTIILSSLLYWSMEKERLLAGKNITESAIATVYEVSALRGFGVSLFDEAKTEPLASFVSVAFAGPFSNGGGLTLLVFVALASIFKSLTKSAEVKVSRRLIWMLIIISGISLLPATFGLLIGAISLNQVISCFTGNSVSISPDMAWGSAVWLSWLMLAGKLSLVIASFWYIISAEKSKP
ncbi:MAG: hypothetical protein U5K79_09320 [Cyclobacteriaceae bacterium]|nr:hypothetical protein [Cyclobacteriaceae bacterium]